MVATSVSLPYEVYDLTVKVTWLRVGALAINLLLVAYLVWTKRLFGVRGGKQAYEARLRTDYSFIEVEQAGADGGSGAADRVGVVVEDSDEVCAGKDDSEFEGELGWTVVPAVSWPFLGGTLSFPRKQVAPLLLHSGDLVVDASGLRPHFG